MRQLKYLIFMLAAISAQGQTNARLTAADILKKAADKMRDAPYYSFSTAYALYENYSSAKAKETHTGITLKKDGVYYNKIKNTEFVGFKGYTVKVNSDQKAIQIVKTDHAQLPVDIESYLKGYQLKLIGNNKTYWICEISPPKVSQVPFSKILFYVNRKDFTIIGQKTYLFGHMENDQLISGQRLEATFKERKPSPNDSFLTSEKNYFIRSGKEIKPAARFNGYKLFKA